MLVVVLAWLAGREQAPAVNVARAAMEPLVVAITGNGKVEPVTPHTLRAPLATFIQKVHALEGRAVRRGELLVEMDSTE